MTKHKWMIILITIVALGMLVAFSQTLHGLQAREAVQSAVDHGDYDEAPDEQGHDTAEEEGLHLTAEQRERFGIVVEPAGPGPLHTEISLPGEIVFNEDRVVHVVPRVTGIAREVHKTVGDTVTAGEVLAVIDSRELADAKAAFLSARARTTLAEKTFTREQILHEQQISSERDFLEAEQVLAEARILLRSAQQKLYALGLSEAMIEQLEQEPHPITRYEIPAPLSGVITNKHITLGENLEATSPIFTVVDISHVWVNLTVYTKHLAGVYKGQDVVLTVDHNGAQTLGQVSMVTPFVETSTRSATARIVLDNSDGRWMPGTFVSGVINLSQENLPIVVSRGSVQTVSGNTVVFVEHEGDFEITPVVTGRSDRERIEILSGLPAGTSYVSQGAFELKATLVTSTLGSHAGHGH